MMNFGLCFHSFLIPLAISRTPWMGDGGGVNNIQRNLMHNTNQQNYIIIFRFPAAGLLNVGASTSYNSAPQVSTACYRGNFTFRSKDRHESLLIIIL
jgi:hypothetical protein